MKLNAQTVKRTILYFFRTCNIYKRQREIMVLKYQRNITYLEVKKIGESYMKDNTYANVVWRASPISNNNNQFDQYRALIKISSTRSK